jgi:N-acetylmuramoyl-L-alanine amidase CwlA
MNIIKSCAITNTTAKRNRQIKYIVIHYTAGTHSERGQALAVASMFARGTVGGSADFIVDDVDIVQYNEDIQNRFCWSVGGSKYTSMSTTEGGKFYNKCTNANSISIEMCSSKKDRSNLSGASPDWYLTAAVLDNAVKLTKFLMLQYNIPIDHVIMHHHVTGKLCPQPWTLNQERLTGWYDFTKRLSDGEDEEMIETINMDVNGKALKADAIIKNGETFIKMRALENAGFDVDYNKETKLRIIKTKTNDQTVNYYNIKEKLKSVNIAGNNYVNIRELAELLNLDIGFDPETKEITLNIKIK